MFGTFWALVPPIIAIALALITKEVYSSLFIGTVAGALSPLILYGDNSICGYVQGIQDGTLQSLKTKIWMLFFYTIFHGIMMFLAGVPFFFYKLTGARKAEIHAKLLEQRKTYDVAAED